MEKNCVVKDVVFDVGYVYFTAVADGNAVIAVKDAGGNILWSWHIWVTGYDPNNEYDTWCIGVKMMNRNLGALSKEPEDGALTHGLLYQWGRKDPFVSTNYRSTSMATTPTEPAAPMISLAADVKYAFFIAFFGPGALRGLLWPSVRCRPSRPSAPNIRGWIRRHSRMR